VAPSRGFIQLEAQELRWSFEDPVFGPIPVVVSVPARQNKEQRLPVLVTFHGRGESKKGPERGVRGWLDDYGLERALGRVQRPPLTRDDFQGLVDGARLREHNERLLVQPYRPLIVVMPYLPDVLKRAEAFDNTARLSALIVDQLLEKVYAETPARAEAQHTGIDGVSLGGRASLLIGLTRPTAFGVVGALQAAIDESEIWTFTQLAQSALKANPELRVRLLTSRDDAYLDVNEQLHRSLNRAGVRATLDVVRGPHNYNFNRGPGCYEMLLFQEAALYR
jgi:iron(III)-salmochelin esterase